MEEAILSEIEWRLSHFSARMEDALELLQTTAATVKRAGDILVGLETEIEELYVSLGDESAAGD